MDTLDIVTEKLGIPTKYVKISSKNRVVIVVHRTWIRVLLRTQQIPEFICHESLNADEVGVWLQQDEDFGSSWQKLYVKIVRKQHKKVIPLPRARTITAKAEPELSFAQFLHYVSQTNHKNLWKEAFKKYLCDTVSAEGKGNPKINLVKFDAVMRDIILRTYGCPMIYLNGRIAGDTDAKVKSYVVHTNLLPALCALETNGYFFIIQQPYIPHTLQDCVTFSPAMLGTSYAKPLFIIYQLLQAMRTMHDRGLVVGDVTLSDILIKENLWIQILPQLEDNIHDKPKTEKKKPSKNSMTFSRTRSQSKHEEEEDEDDHDNDGDDDDDDDLEEENTRSCSMCNSPLKMRQVGSTSSLDHLQDTLPPSCQHCNPPLYVDTHSKAEVDHHQSSLSHSHKNTKSLNDIRNNYMRTLGIIPGSHKSNFKFQESPISVGESAIDVNEVNLEHLCKMWVYGQLSNFDYLTALNHLAGRRYGDPTSHHVMPWVTDFTSRSGSNWRDLSRSKFRLNKGDHQLDLTYDTAAGTSQVPHHVSDVLSEITYYVYLSRRTPRSVLCKYVRTNWVPAEYPSSIQRLQEWTPDECIPEFFTDPSVFESIHDDLPDLEIPNWASSTQDFVEKHREILESVHVSEKLHHWIDLTFGYKLSGSAAIKSKNVCLQLVDSHTTLTNTGVVQLFTQPHPQRHLPSPFWGKAPPKLHLPTRDKKKPFERVSEDEGHSSGFEEEESAAIQGQSRSSPLALSRLLSRSRGSLLTPFPSQSGDDSNSRDRASDQQKSSGSTGVGSVTPAIILPKEYNPASALQAVEQLHSFLGKTFHFNTTSSLPQFHNEDASTNMSYKQVVACRRIREMQVLGCLVIELFLPSKLRALGNSNWSSFEQRLRACISVLFRYGESLPCCVRQAISLLLQIELNPSLSSNEENLMVDLKEELSKSVKLNAKTTQPFRYPTVTSQGLPPPSAHQLLQPILSSAVFPFPHYFTRTYSLLQNLYEYSSLAEELNLVCFVSDDENTSMNNENEKKRAAILTKINECKVKTAARELATLLPEMLSTFSESLDLIIPYIRELLEDPSSSVLAAWHLFDSVSKVLGPQKTAATLLESIVKLYDYASNDDNSSGVPDIGNKHVKLYHRSFLLALIVRLGLRVFLENFAAPLVEAVGGYRDYTHSEQSHHHHRSEFRNKASHLKSCDLDEGPPEVEGILSPLDEDSSADSEQNKPPDETQGKEEKKREEEESDTEVEPEVFVFENEENGKTSPTGEEEAPIYNLMDHLGLNLPQAAGEVEDSSSLELAGDEESGNPLEEDSDDGMAAQTEYEFVPDNEPKSPGHSATGNSSSQDTKESGDGGDSETSKRSDTDSNFTRGQGSLQKDDRSRKFTSQCKVSDMSADSVIWLSHRLGPVLTARYLSRNLLRMLTLCYLGQENLSPLLLNGGESKDILGIPAVSITKQTVIGDENAAKVLECLASIAALYGEQFILLQYLPHMGELIALCKRKLTFNLEGGLVGCLALLKHIVPYLCDATLMDQLQDVILKTILHPAMRLVSTTRFMFPSGSIARAAVTAKFVDAVYVVALRIGCEMTKRHLAVPSLQRFFLTFDKAFGRPVNQHVEDLVTPGKTTLRSLEENSYLDVCRDGSTVDSAVKGIPMQISHVRVRESDSADSFSPPPLTGSEGDHPQDATRNKAVEELKQVFTSELAHVTYLSFFRFLGESVMESSLKNHEFVRDLCYEYEQEMQSIHPGGSSVDVLYLSSYLSPGAQGDLEKITGSGSFGSNVAVIGNRIDLQRADIPSLEMLPSSSPNLPTPGGDLMTLISKKMENTNRHLHGNWLAYWEHEIGRAEKDVHFNFKQIKLQTFTGHTNSVRAVLALDNENSFISGSRDKTVKLWSLRSQGDGSAISQCQWTYTGHRKTVLAITFLESLRLAASCDSVVHLWDPFMGCMVAQLDSGRNPPITVLRAMPPPSVSLMAATTDATLRLLDARTCSFVSELRVSLSPAGLIRCIAVGPNGNWAAVGQSSGYLTILDIRTGMILASWKGHEGEVLQLVATNDNTLVSSSLDQTVSVWSATDGKLNFHMKGPTEPVHCMSGYGHELITGTTANRIGVHTSVDSQASFSSTRLRSDTFKGVLTAMAVLPLNRLLLLGADTGNISLLC